MNTNDLIRHMCEKSGMSMREVSVKMGKSATYINSIFGKKATPNVTTLFEIARVCGYVLQVNGHGEIVTVEPRKD